MTSGKYLVPLLCILLLTFPAQTCVNDTYCEDCRFYIVTLIPTLTGYLLCAQCSGNRQIDSDTGDCQCASDYYQKSDGQCSECPEECSSCVSANNCTKCQDGLVRELVKNKCVCAEGFEQVSGSAVCQEKQNILMVVLSSIGSVLCLIVSAVVCVVLRYRRYSKVHTERTSKKPRQSSRNIEVQVYEEGGMENTSNVLFGGMKMPDFKQNETCSICLDGDALFITDCGHYFHGKCIFSWLQNKKMCPNCNKDIKSKDVRRWCEKCKKNLMTVLKNVVITKVGKKKKEVVKSTPVEHQICDYCENDEKSESSHEKEREKDTL